MADDYIKPAQFARLVEKDRAFISRLMTGGYLSYTVNEKGRKMLNPVLAKEELLAYLNNSASPKSQSMTQQSGTSEVYPAPNSHSEDVPGTFRQGNAKTKSQIELEIREVELETKMIALAKEKGILITKEFHDKEHGELISQVLMKFDQLPGRVSEQLADDVISMVKSDEPIDQIIATIESVIGEECDKAKEEIADA